MPAETSAHGGTRDWLATLAVYRHPRVIVMLFLGFSAGLPFLLVFATLSAWLRDVGVSRSEIGFFSWIGITFSIKVFWAPVVDAVALPGLTRWLGQRRGWMLLAQVGIACGLLGIAWTDPVAQTVQVALFALLVAFAAATQDIVIDAYRIEAVGERLQGAMAATYQLGYRFALLAAGAGALYIADLVSWTAAYGAMAALTLVGMATVALIGEPAHPRAAASEGPGGGDLSGLRAAGAWAYRVVARPFIEFFSRNGMLALVILLFIGVYRLSDITMGVMANPFYIDLGFTLSEIASVTKVYGVICSIVGAVLGGLLVVRFGIMRPLLLGAVMVAGTNLLFAWLATRGADIAFLAVTISADNISGGLAGSVFIAYLSSLTNRAYTATQYALFSSLFTLPGKFLGGFSGVIVDSVGYYAFFLYASALGIPAILLVIYLARQVKAEPQTAESWTDQGREERS